MGFCAKQILDTLMSSNTKYTPLSDDLVLAFGNYWALRCKACSKRTKQRCRGYAVLGYDVCRMHGAGGGPTTKEGIERIATAQLVHGRDTRAIRRMRQTNRAKLLHLIEMGRSIGLFKK